MKKTLRTSGIEIFEKYISSSHFAVILLIVAIIYFILATIVESVCGSAFSAVLFYRSWGMGIIAFFAILSIYFALMNRLKMTKKNIAFHVLHWGILLVFAGGFFTFYSGIDGQVTLFPDVGNHQVELHDKELVLTQKSSGKVVEKRIIPASAFTYDLNYTVKGARFAHYVPFAKDQLVWIEKDNSLSAQLELRMGDEVLAPLVFSLAADSGFRHEAQVGPLQIFFFPSSFSTIADETLWDSINRCFDVLKGESISPEQAAIRERSTCLSESILSRAPTMILSGELLYLYHKEHKKLILYHHFQDTSVAKLPWMNLELHLQKYSPHSYPDLRPVYAIPFGEDKERFSTLEMTLGDQMFWLREGRPETLRLNNELYDVELRTTKYALPYELILSQFQLTRDEQGNPSSYQSDLFVSDRNNDLKLQQISMNKPLNVDSFNLYQTSYFQIGPDQYASVLTVSYDPGRFLKYLGSFLVLLGAFLYYLWAIRPSGGLEND